MRACLFCSSRRRHTRCALVTGVHTCALPISAFEAIYNRYWSRLYSAAYRRVRSREACQEIIQDLFTSFWLGRKELTLRTSLESYLYAATRYKVFNHIEKELVRDRKSTRLNSSH